jgi:FPC/CPF motif-containing protein YcgG
MFASPEDAYSDEQYKSFLKNNYKKLSIELKNDYIVPLQAIDATTGSTRIGAIYTIENSN